MPESAANRILTEADGEKLFGGRVPKGERWANVRDYFSTFRIEGVDDDRPAFEAARLTGRPVYAPTGRYYLSSSPAWGNNSAFMGDGKGRTIIKLMDSAPADATLWCNADLSGNTNGYFADFTLDGNCDRQGGTLLAAGGSRSSCFTLRNAHNFYIERVSAINALQHGFDVTRGHLDYAYAGDGVVMDLRSSDIYFDQCDATNFGDDGFTTHHSDFVTISRSIASNPRRRENCNGFEIDGDSRDCTLEGNRSYGCYAGVEIKGHGSESAAQNIAIKGHRDEGSVRSYNFRHIGYHSGTDPVSKTAKNIIASDLYSINPNNDKGFQDTATPRAMVISAYHGVSVSGLHAIGRGGYAAGDVAVAVQFRSGDITLSGVHIEGWTGAGQDLSITSGDNVSVFGLTTRNSANRAVYTGAEVKAVQIFGVNAHAPEGGSIYAAVDIYNSEGVDVYGVSPTGYAKAIRADSVDYLTEEAYQRRTHRLPAGVTRLADLDPLKDYYITTSEWATLTDIPPGTSGGYWVQHSRPSVDSAKQSVTRNTSSATLQTDYYRAWNFVAKSSGPWVAAGSSAPLTITWETMPASSVGYVPYDAATSTWKPRPTTRTNVRFHWTGPVQPTAADGFVEGVDLWENLPA